MPAEFRQFDMRISVTTRVALLVLGVLLAACATADPINFANGQKGYAIKCDLGLNGLDMCYRKAGELCGERGYSLHDWQGNPVTYKAVERDLDASFSGFSAKTILVECNAQDFGGTAVANPQGQN
jgi:hypothetical protein